MQVRDHNRNKAGVATHPRPKEQATPAYICCATRAEKSHFRAQTRDAAAQSLRLNTEGGKSVARKT